MRLERQALRIADRDALGPEREDRVRALLGDAAVAQPDTAESPVNVVLISSLDQIIPRTLSVTRAWPTGSRARASSRARSEIVPSSSPTM